EFEKQWYARGGEDLRLFTPNRTDLTQQEVDHANTFGEKVLDRYREQPELLSKFKEIFQIKESESILDLKPWQDLYAQTTQLFSSDPDLLEAFEQWWPKDQAGQAIARAAKEAMTMKADELDDVGRSIHIHNQGVAGTGKETLDATALSDASAQPLYSPAHEVEGQKRSSRQGGKNPSCDECRTRKLKCDATDDTNCSECTDRNRKCQFTDDLDEEMLERDAESTAADQNDAMDWE
ncbi:MAG: hypothetical protein Q9224_007017, partial [Gallowayella concinna]